MRRRLAACRPSHSSGASGNSDPAYLRAMARPASRQQPAKSPAIVHAMSSSPPRMARSPRCRAGSPVPALHRGEVAAVPRPAIVDVPPPTPTRPLSRRVDRRPVPGVEAGHQEQLAGDGFPPRPYLPGLRVGAYVPAGVHIPAQHARDGGSSSRGRSPPWPRPPGRGVPPPAPPGRPGSW